jgi:hypothetical protein
LVAKGFQNKKNAAGNPFKTQQNESKSKDTIKFNFATKLEEGKEAEYLEMIKVEQLKFISLANLPGQNGKENLNPN